MPTGTPDLQLKERSPKFAAAMARLSALKAAPDADEVLTKAVRRAAANLGLSQKELARVLGVSEATVSRLAGGKHLEVSRKEGELGLLFLRVYRSLDAMVGGSKEKSEAWISAQNADVGGVPRERIQTVEGLVHVAQYLDAMRGKL
jgi:transcriptional regulator with XRE-family HTH domain